MDSDKNAQKRQNKNDFFDIRWSLYSWTENRDNYKIIVDLISEVFQCHDVVEVLDEINTLLDTGSTTYIFDGTIDSLRYLIEYAGLDVTKIKNPLLKKIVFKHLFDFKESTKTDVNPNRWSPQALRCKAILIGLYIKNNKLFIKKGLKAADHIQNLNEKDFPIEDDDVEKNRLPEESVMRLTTLNAM